MEKAIIVAVRVEDGTVMDIWSADWDGKDPKTPPNKLTNYKVAETAKEIFPMEMGLKGGPNVVQKSESWNIFSVSGSPGCTYICTSSGCRKVCN